jgi:hypothetical protein
MDSHHEPGGYYLIGRVSFFFFKSLWCWPGPTRGHRWCWLYITW